MPLDPALLDWLLDADPALRWQVERDLAGAPAGGVGGDPGPGRHRGFRRATARAAGSRRPVGRRGVLPAATSTSTAPRRPRTRGSRGPRRRGRSTPSATGASTPPRSPAPPTCSPRTVAGSTTTCRTGAARSTAASTPTRWPTARGSGRTSRGIAQWFLDHRLADGGWNCEWVEGSTRSSFHSTLNSLKGLLYYEAATGAPTRCAPPVEPARSTCWSAGCCTACRPGELVGPWVTRFAYPFRWFYSALNAAELLPGGGAARRHRARSPARGRDRGDPRRPPPDGTWLQERRHPGRVWFEVDVPPGEPSKWLTFYGTRVLAWWDGATRE